jgi:hypothetical protein
MNKEINFQLNNIDIQLISTKKYKTITYEVLVNISKRAIREYLK